MQGHLQGAHLTLALTLTLSDHREASSPSPSPTCAPYPPLRGPSRCPNLFDPDCDYNYNRKLYPQ